MKRFKFRLQTLLDQRIAAEDKLMGELAEIRREEAAEIAKLEGLHATLERVWSDIEQVLKSSASPTAMTQLDEYAKALRDDIKVQQLTIQAVRGRIESKLAEVTEAMKQRKVIQTLRDKQEQAYLAEAMRAEQSALDEMSSLRYARGM